MCMYDVHYVHVRCTLCACTMYTMCMYDVHHVHTWESERYLSRSCRCMSCVMGAECNSAVGTLGCPRVRPEGGWYLLLAASWLTCACACAHLLLLLLLLLQLLQLLLRLLVLPTWSLSKRKVTSSSHVTVPSEFASTCSSTSSAVGSSNSGSNSSSSSSSGGHASAQVAALLKQRQW